MRNVYSVTVRGTEDEPIRFEFCVESTEYSPAGEMAFVQQQIDLICEERRWTPQPFHIDYLKELETGLPISEPPRTAERLFGIFAPKDTVDAQLGDLQQLYERDCFSLGEKRARERFNIRVLRSLVPLALQKAKRLGIIALLIEIGRRKFGF
jgi:hypothetical protein